MSILVTNDGPAPARRAVTKREPAGTSVKLTLECGHVRYTGKHSRLATLPRAMCNECISIDFELTATGREKVAAFEAGRAAWRALDTGRDTLEFPANPYGDEYQNPAAQAFRSGFDVAARKDGYTYSRVDGEYRQGGEFETDELPEGGDVRELA